MLTPGRVRVIALWVADMSCVCALWFFSVWSYWGLGRWLRALGMTSGFGGYDPAIYLAFWPVPLFFCVTNAILETYQGSWMYPSAPLSPVEEMRRLFGSAFLTHVGVIAYLGFAYQTTDGYSRVVIALSGVLVAIGAQSFRNWMRRLLFWSGRGQIPVVLSGSGETARRIAATLKDDAYCGYRLVGYFSGARWQGRRIRRTHGLEELGVPYLGPLTDIVAKAKKRDIKVLVACQDERLFRAQMGELSSWFTYIDFMPTAQAFPVFGSRAVTFDGLGGLEMVNQGRMRAKRFQKRLLDMTCAIVAFVLTLPLFVMIAVLVKLTSRGPVFYRHARLGRDGKPFKVWKFRSMYVDAEARLKRLLAEDPARAEEWAKAFKLRSDPRITPLGRLLRKTSLDELPQLFNVFSGDMALVGPRPIVADEVAYYGANYAIFASVKPGVTGLWQVSGRSDTDYDRRVSLDTYYVLNWSPWMDIWILIRTVYAVLFMRGAR